MALSEIQVRAAELIYTDPDAMKAMQEQVHRLDPQGKVIPKSALPDVMMDEKINGALKPLREQNEELRKKLEEKTQLDYHQSQRDFMKREYRLDDKKLDELVEWMTKDADGNLFKSYEAAYRYRLAMSQPTLPNGAPPSQQKVSAFTRRPAGAEPWREQFKDPKHPLRQSKAEAKAWAREQWKASDEEYLRR